MATDTCRPLGGREVKAGAETFSLNSGGWALRGLSPRPGHPGPWGGGSLSALWGGGSSCPCSLSGGKPWGGKALGDRVGEGGFWARGGVCCERWREPVCLAPTPSRRQPPCCSCGDLWAVQPCWWQASRSFIHVSQKGGLSHGVTAPAPRGHCWKGNGIADAPEHSRRPGLHR